MDEPRADQKLLIHIGYHKTGTTWLQRTLFVPANGYCQLLDHQQINELLVRPYPLAFDSAEVTARTAAARAAMPEGCVPVLSSEILSGNPFYGGRDCTLCAARLRECFPGARILITIREQIAAIASTYMQYVRRGGTLPPDRFFEPRPEPGYNGFDPRHFEYDRLVAEYRRLFGGENVLVVTNELLAKSAMAAATQIAEFSSATPPREVNSTRVGVSAPEASAGLLRVMNRLRSGPTSTATLVDLGRLGLWIHRGSAKLYQLPPLRSHAKARRPVLEAVRARYAGQFADSNRRLTGLIGPMADLSRYEGAGDAAAAGPHPQDIAPRTPRTATPELRSTRS